MASRVSASGNALRRACKAAAASAAGRSQYLSHFSGPSERFGPRLASSLLPALEAPAPASALLNCFASRGARAEYLRIAGACARVPVLPALEAWARLDGGAFPPVLGAGAAGVLTAYHLDAASLLPVCALDPARGARVLDMCAAPGGKALALAQLLRGASPRGSLTANDISAGRRRRLREVLSLYLPPLREGERDDDAAPPAVTLAAVDATLPGAFGSAAFDAVLLDAPCSNDRHLLRDAAELAAWGPGRIKNNALRQSALLARALDAVRPGGAVVYSTCALSRRENDDVVAKALAKAAGAVSLVPLTFAFGEPTPLGGWLVLPDTAAGAGPMYMAKLVRAPAVPPGVRGDYSCKGVTKG
jgi:hypothetical protein